MLPGRKGSILVCVRVSLLFFLFAVDIRSFQMRPPTRPRTRPPTCQAQPQLKFCFCHQSVVRRAEARLPVIRVEMEVKVEKARDRRVVRGRRAQRVVRDRRAQRARPARRKARRRAKQVRPASCAPSNPNPKRAKAVKKKGVLPIKRQSQLAHPMLPTRPPQSRCGNKWSGTFSRFITKDRS